MSKIINKDPMSILKKISAEVSGLSPDHITFSNFRDKKATSKYKYKKNVDNDDKSVIIGNSEGFDISSSETKCCSYGDIPLKKQRTVSKKDSLEEWGAFDFFNFARTKYVERYGETWNLKIGGSSLTINRIREKFYDLFGFCCNLTMRDYIDFFFEYYMDYHVSNKGFFFTSMLDEKIICEFHDGYDFSQSFSEHIKNEKIIGNESFISQKEIKDSFLIGDTSLVSNYGIVISLNWLLIVKKIPTKDAIKLVISACKELHIKGMIDVVKKSTELYSPYPSNLVFKSPQVLMDKIDKNIKVYIEFNESCNKKLQFLQKKGK